MKALSVLALTGGLLLTVATAAPAQYRQRYYTARPRATSGYRYRTYYYRPYSTPTRYRYYVPRRPYYSRYTPYRRVYWGRPVQNGVEVYPLPANAQPQGALPTVVPAPESPPIE